MTAQPFEESLMAHLTEKYPDEDQEQLLERFESINARRLWLISQSGKTCNQCNTFKSLSEFGTDTREQDCLHTTCKECRSTKTKGSA